MTRKQTLTATFSFCRPQLLS